MALKKSVTADEHKKLSKDIQAEYVADGDTGNFKLDVEGGIEDADALKRAKDHEKEQRKTAEKALKTAQDALATLTEERDNILKGAIPKADADKLEKSYQQKLATRETELTTQINTLTGNLNTMLVDNVATTLATKLSTSPAVLLPHIKSRLKADMVDGKAVTKVLDAAGAPSAATLDDLEKEFLVNKAFAPILIGSKGSGGGAGGAGGSGGAANVKKIDLAKATPKEIAEHMKARGIGQGT